MVLVKTKIGKARLFTDEQEYQIFDLCKEYTEKSVAEYKGCSVATVKRIKRDVREDPERYSDYMTKEEYARLAYKRDVKESRKG